MKKPGKSAPKDQKQKNLGFDPKKPAKAQKIIKPNIRGR